MEYIDTKLQYSIIHVVPAGVSSRRRTSSRGPGLRLHLKLPRDYAGWGARRDALAGRARE